jgi:hypothetical protein
MKTLLFALAIACTSVSQAAIQVYKVGDVAVAQQNQDGTYDVICKNGNREKVTDLDLSLDNVCPNKTSSEPTNILSLQLREDGNFDVVCKDMRKVVAPPQDIIDGKVCLILAPAVGLESGHYVASNENYYDHTVTAKTNDKGELASLDLVFENGYGTVRVFTCEATECASTDGYSLTVTGATAYRFHNGDVDVDFTKK